MNRWSQLGNKQPTDNRHYTLKISGFIRFVVNLEKMNYTHEGRSLLLIHKG